MGAVRRLTGLSAHVIRAWERRHNAIEPGRNKAGTRRYSEADIERLKLLRDAIQAGHRIGVIADLDNERIRGLLPEPTGHDGPAVVDRMLAAVRHLDGPQLDQLLAREVLALRPFDFCRLAVCPVLDRIGEDWTRGKLSVAEEHLASAAIKSTLLSLLRFGSDRSAGDMMLFSTLPGERHEIGALMAAVCVQNAGARVLYLGPDLPISELVTAARRSAAKVVGISAAMPATEEQMTNLGKLHNQLPRGIGDPRVVRIRTRRDLSRGGPRTAKSAQSAAICASC